MRILLLGLGRANQAVARYLVQKGEQVFVFEENMQKISAAAQELINSGQVKKHGQDNYDLVITSPGFPPNHPVYKDLKSSGMHIIDEIEFVYQELKEPKIIAVTGTNGKSTTAALISSILDEAGIRNFLGGNIAPGTPFSEALFLAPFRYYVLEVSSFQLLRIKHFRPHIAVLTNLGVDHLNWHRDIDEYKNAKLRIFANQERADFAVLNYDDDLVRAAASRMRAHVVFFGFLTRQGVAINGKFHYDHHELFSSQDLPLPGRHNMMNAAAAIAVSKALKLDDSKIERGLRTFRGLPHRLEDLGDIKGVRYINNSMCTNASAAIASFQAVTGPKIVIIGGKHKGDQGEHYFNLLVKEAKACIILGENAWFVARYFEEKGFRDYAIAKDMTDAVNKARAFSDEGDVIMLNPGFASFDYFGDFLERGEAFRNAIHQD
jgi:UDP-N-acetylmuramoylalanine--D-glutamate ligase